MSQTLHCPNCGGEHTIANPGIAMLVCHYCNTALYWDEDAVLNVGVQSILPEDDTRLHIGATGRILGEGFRVIGHVRYDHGRGHWDEWYLELDSSETAWVSEDGRRLSLERPLEASGASDDVEMLRVGGAVELGGTTFTVRELGEARCVGGQGQLPFTVLPEETYPYADIASIDGKHLATLEYDEYKRARGFIGQPLGHEDLVIDDEDQPKEVAGTTRRIDCANCAAPQERPGNPDAETLVCTYCGAQLDLTTAEAEVLGVNPKDFEPGFLLEIGRAGEFPEGRFEVSGRMLYRDDEGYQTREYILYNPSKGYLWLAEESGHWVQSKPTNIAPAAEPFALRRKQTVDIGGQSFRFFESGSETLVYVDGALPWKASVGDSHEWADLIDPPYIFSAEADSEADEVEYFRGTYMPVDQLWEAFQLEPPVVKPYGVHAAQPFNGSPMANALAVVGVVFALINLGLFIWSLSASGGLIFNQAFSNEQYLKETITQPFVVGSGDIMQMELSAPLDNSWLALEVAFLNDQGLVVSEAAADAAYYHGVEGGESWSEGSRTSSTCFKSPPPGNYQLIIKGEAGSGNTGPPREEQLTVRIYQGTILSRYFLILLVVAATIPAFVLLRRFIFESRRWGADDDDD